jgi:phage FluMu protein Com
LFATGQIRRLVIKCPRCKRWITYCDTQTGKKGSHT